MPDETLTANIPEEKANEEPARIDEEAAPAVEAVAETPAPEAKQPVEQPVEPAPMPAPAEEIPVQPAQPVSMSNAAEEMELNVSLDQLSYICEYCGKVNPIAAPSCARCGKRRPRSEYVNAMNRIKNAQSVKERYVAEQAKLAADRQDAAQQQLARLVEERVADERAHYVAQEKIRFEEEQEAIKRSTARDAVMRIIAAEKAADEKVQAAEKRAEEAMSGRSREVEERIAEEREKVLYAAAKRVVSERAGIENAAEERILATKKETERKAQENIAFAVEEAERNAARRAVLKVVATEQAANDRTRLERDAIARAALDRVEEEKKIAEINAYSKYKIEKEAMQRAVDERIKAERDALYARRGEVGQNNMTAGAQQVQPLAIVPYVNSRQPLFQYTTAKTVYKFVPDDVPQQPASAPTYVQPKQKKKQCMRIWGVILAILAVAMAVLALAVFQYVEGYKNLDAVMSLFQADSDYKAAFGGNLWMGTMLPIGIIAAVVGDLVVLITAIIVIAKNKFNWGVFVGAVVALIGAVLAFISPVLAETAEIDAMLQTPGQLINVILAVVIFVLALILSIVQTKKNKKEKQL